MRAPLPLDAKLSIDAGQRAIGVAEPVQIVVTGESDPEIAVATTIATLQAQ